MITNRLLFHAALTLLALAPAGFAHAQSSAAAPTASPSLSAQTSSAGTGSGGMTIGVRGFALFGQTFFTASDSFDAILDSHSGPVFGGGAQVLFPYGLYAEVAAWRFSADGERAFVTDGGEVFPLGLPTTVKVTPIELTAGWRYRGLPHVMPYGGGGVTWSKYEETGAFAAAGDDVDDRFTGYHVLGGAEVRLLRWLHAAGEVSWTSVPDALGSGGVSAVFGEDDLGGTTVRVKVLVGF